MPPTRQAQRDNLCRQCVDQRLRVLQVARIEPFGKPPVDRSEQFEGLLRLTLVAPRPRHAHRRTQFPGLRVMGTSNPKRAPKYVSAFAAFGSGDLRAISPATRLASAS